MNIFLGFLTVIMFLDCIILIFLVLLQLPKKEAGAGMAFGGAATDALFGAGSGNALTNITKYVAGIFFGLALLIAVCTGHKGKSGGESLENSLTARPPGASSRLPAPAPAAGQPASGSSTAPGLLDMPAPTAPATTPAPVKAEAPAAGTNK